MKIIQKTNNHDFPLKWANLDYYPESIAEKKEIYTIDQENLIEELTILFYTLFGNRKSNILTYNASWWNFCVEVWDPNKDEYNYDITSKSRETKDYLEMLNNSNIEIGYGGNCRCLDWDAFLPIIISCLVNHKAPYSPILYDEINNFFFYFHHTGSIGLYYHELNEVVNQILTIANIEYEIRK